MKHTIEFEKIGGSLQPAVRNAADLAALLDLRPAYWSITSVDVDAVALDPVFLKFMDSDGNGKIRVDEAKAAIAWLLGRLNNMERTMAGSKVLRLADLNPEDAEARDIRASAVLALKNSGVEQPEEISLALIRNRKKIIAAGLSNGDGIIPVSLLTDPELISVSRLIVKLSGTVPDASGLDGFARAGVDKFARAAEARVKWLDVAAETPEILPFGDETGELFAAWRQVEGAIDDFFDLCAALRLFGPDRLSAPPPAALMDREAMAAALEKAPAAAPNPERVFRLHADLNPRWRARIENFFRTVLPGQSELSEPEWLALKEKFAPYAAWLNAKPSDDLDGENPEVLRAALKSGTPEKLRTLIDRDLAFAKEIANFDRVEKLILFQAHLVEFLNNYVNLRILFDPRAPSILQAGTLVMGGQCFTLVTRVTNPAEHKKIAARSNICVLYVEARTGPKDAVRTMRLAAAVTSGNMYHLFIGKHGVFFTPDGEVWDAQAVDCLQQPVSIAEALQMPFFRFGSFIGKQMDKFFTARSKEFERNVDQKMSQVEKFAASGGPAGKAQTPAVSGSMMLMGGGIGLAAIGSACAFIAQSLKNISFWNVLGLFLVIMLIFGGPMVVISLVKLYRRSIAVFLEAGGLAVNKRLRLSRLMSRIFTEHPIVPGMSLKDRTDTVRALLRKREADNAALSARRKLSIMQLLVIAGLLVLWGYILFRALHW